MGSRQVAVIKSHQLIINRKENISRKLVKKNKFAAAQVKIFLVTRISGNKSIVFFGLNLFKQININHVFNKMMKTSI